MLVRRIKIMKRRANGFSYRKPKETLIKSQSQLLQEFLYIASS